MFTLVVDICTDSSGRVYSTHRLQTPLDHEVAMKMPGGGQEQVAFALAVEAARREAILGLLLLLSQDPHLLERLKASVDQQQDVLGKISKGLREQFANTVARIADDVAKEALQTALS
jgi:hypothetical protein